MTPLDKSYLESVILEFLYMFNYIGRDKHGLYIEHIDKENNSLKFYNHRTDLFLFIKNGEKYSIEELNNRC